MKKSRFELRPYVEVMLSQQERVFEGWTTETGVARLLERWKLSPVLFIERFGRGIYDHLIEVIKGSRDPGDCPSLRALLVFLADRQVSVGDVFALCIQLRHQVGEGVYFARFQGGDIEDYRAFLVELHALFDANLRGVLDGYYQSLQDKERQIDRMRAEGESKDKLLHLQAREATIGEMIGAIAHQWKQPLSVVSLSAQELIELCDEGACHGASVRESAEVIYKQAVYMNRTIDDFRRFLQPAKECESFSLQAAVDDVMGLIGRQYHNRGIDIRFEAHEDPTLTGYRNDFVQVFLILLSNARDAILGYKKQGTVQISLQLKPQKALVNICDEGGGIPEDLLPRLFTPYQTTKEQGTGIGLYIARRIIEKMGGTITAANTPKGACFEIVLPCTGEGCLK